MRTSRLTAASTIGPRSTRLETPVPLQGILSIGRDLDLLSFREPVLRKLGSAVWSCSPEDAPQLLCANSYQIAIFCHTLSREQAVRLACTAHRHCPATKLLLLINNRPRGFEGMLFDDALETLEGPEALLKHVRKLLNRP